MKRKGSDIVLDVLESFGVDTIFGYPGGAVIPLYDALYDRQEDIKHIRTAHEQGAVHSADGYARATGKLGVCIVTSGPGATNAMTGIATAYMDSTPLLVLSGQVPSMLIGKDSFQEIDITGMSLPITKYNSLVESIEELEKTLKKACEVALSGRPGPVLVDIPKDIFLKEMTTSLTYDYKIQNQVPPLKTQQIEEICELINTSERPIIYAGGGVKLSGTEKLLKEIAQKNSIPVTNTLMGLGTFDRKDPLSLGLVGMHGAVKTNKAMMEADLILAIGARFSDRVIGNPKDFAKTAKVIHIDIDLTEFDKNIDTTYSICGDLKDVLVEMLPHIRQDSRKKWIEKIAVYHQEVSFKNPDFNPKTILKSFSDVYENAYVTTDVGQHQMWTAQMWPFNNGRSFITSGGLGTMGFGLGAALGAKLGLGDEQVILITGDGSFRMSAVELFTISEYHIPIIIVVLNNHALGMVRQWQKLFQNERYSETCVERGLDFCKLGLAYGIESHKVDNIEDLNKIIGKLGEIDRPILIECQIDKDEDVYPIVPPGRGIDQYLL